MPGATGAAPRAPWLAPRSIFPRGKRGPGVFRRGFSCKVTVRPIGPKFGHRRVGGDIREGTGEVVRRPPLAVGTVRSRLTRRIGETLSRTGWPPLSLCRRLLPRTANFKLSVGRHVEI